MTALADDRAARTFLGHPRGLFVLFFAETWERFSYYGMRAILVFYLTKHFLFGEDKAYLLYGAYTSLVYITPVIGGALADRWLGARRAVLFGGALIAIGHLTIALVEGPRGAQGGFLQGFYLALAFIVVGTGFLKANVSTIVGQLYPRDDIRRDPAYSIFYMGINVGGAVGPIVVGLLGELWGWGWGFGAAGVGMLAGLVNFVLFQPALGAAGLPPSPQALRARGSIGLSTETTIYAAAIGGVVLIYALIQYQDLVGWLLVAFAAATVAFVLWRAVATLERDARNRILAALFLCALNPLFWGLNEQGGSSLNVFTDQRVDRHLFGFEVPASQFQSLNSIFIIVFAPAFAALWTWLGRRRLEPSTPAKFGIGLALTGLSFLVLVWGAASGNALTPAIYIVLLNLVMTWGELALSPVGLSAMTRLSTLNMAGLMMGVWFLSTAAGEYLAGLIASLTGGAGTGADQILTVYGRIGWLGIAAGAAVVALSPFVRRLMHLDTIGRDDVAHGLDGERTLAEPQAPGYPIAGERPA
ncbi:MAG: MFS transporter [Sphingomonadaceae bacterium]|nr:MFS transporter [Sphingomonadaceae bacterium]